MRRKPDPLISVKSTDAAIAQFWDTHNVTDYLDELEVGKDLTFVKPQMEKRRHRPLKAKHPR